MLSLVEPTHAHMVELWKDFLLLAPCVTVKVIAVWHLQASFLCMWMSVRQYSLCLYCLQWPVLRPFLWKPQSLVVVFSICGRREKYWF